MKIRGRLGALLLLIIGAVGGRPPVALLAQDDRTPQRDRTAIERLHQQDVEATLTGRADDLAKLWDKDAIRIQPGAPVEIGQTVIYAADKREESIGQGQSVCYKSEIKDLQIAGEWAFEWGYFSYKQSAKSKPGRGKVLRVLKRQPGGSWKFARVIGFTETLESAAPMGDSCR